MESLFTIAVVVAALKAHAPPPAEPPKAVAAEQRMMNADKRKPRGKSEPSIGF